MRQGIRDAAFTLGGLAVRREGREPRAVHELATRGAREHARGELDPAGHTTRNGGVHGAALT